ncbi:MAG: class II fructose-bisphosphatase [Oceanidesulfovibrio sp.]
MEAPDRNLALDLVRVTEAAALASARWLGRGDKNAGDQAAVDAMRVSFESLNINGSIVIGEGEKDEAPMLYNGEVVGTGAGPLVDVAVDPVEGTRLLAYGRPNAICVVGIAPRGTMYVPPQSYYMQKLVLPAEAAEAADLDAPIGETLTKAAHCLGKDVDDLVVFVLDKPRHAELIKEIRAAGARIQLHTDGDVMGSLMAVDPRSEVDVMVGTGGTPEGVLSACAIRGMEGAMVCRLDPQSDAERQTLIDSGVDLSEVLTEKTLVRDENVFFACTGISSGTFFQGVRYHGRGATTQSLVIRGKTGTVRYIESHHNWDKLMRISAVKYD